MSADRLTQLRRVRASLHHKGLKPEANTIDNVITDLENERDEAGTPTQPSVSRAACRVDGGGVAARGFAFGVGYAPVVGSDRREGARRRKFASVVSPARQLSAYIHALRHAWGIGLVLGLILTAAALVPASAIPFAVRFVAVTIIGTLAGLMIRKTREFAQRDGVDAIG